MLGTLAQKFSQSLDLLFPPRCVQCNAANSWLCPKCLGNIHYITGPVCRQCGTPTPAHKLLSCQQCLNNPLQHIDGIRATAYFENNPIRFAIHALKYQNNKAVAGTLAELLANTCRQYHLAADVIIPVPLHPSRLKERGYNQSQLLAAHLGRLLNVPVNTVTLQRIRKTKSQMKLGAGERHENVSGAFACKDKTMQNLGVIIIDDVCTTGSTLDACAAALKASNFSAAWGLTLAKAR